MDNKKLNKIPDRIDRIDNMLKGKSMDSIIDSMIRYLKKIMKIMNHQRILEIQYQKNILIL